MTHRKAPLLPLLLISLLGLSGCGAEPPPADAPGATEPPATVQVTRPGPTYTWSDKPSPVVLRLPNRDVELTPWTTCWSGPAKPGGTAAAYCADGAPGTVDELDDVGARSSVDAWFGLPGWKFTATFGQLGTDCPHRWTIDLASTGEQTFRIDPAGPAGRYQVDLFGRGKQGDVALSFVWTTTVDGPVDEPKGRVAVVSQEDELTSYGVEVGISDLGASPHEAAAVVKATAANGRSHSVRLAPEPDEGADGEGCHDAGTLFFRTDEGAEFARLGPAPFTYEVTLTLDDQDYVGTAVWPRDEVDDEAPYTELTWTPALPGYDTP